MSVTLKDVQYIAALAKLKFNDSEIENYTEQLNRILGYVEKLNELNTDDIEPLLHPIENSNFFRDDKVEPSVSTEDALKNAPSKTEEFFRVPKVINQ